MIVDLQDQLRELCTVIDEKQGRIREHDVRTRSDAVMVVGGTSGPAAPDVRRRRWPIAVATATVIIAAALPFLVLSDTEEDSPPADAAASDDWSRVLSEHDVFGGAGDQRMVAITEGGPGLVAVGSDDSLGSQRAAVWTSVDGSTWSRASDQGTDFGTADDETMQDVTTVVPGLVAVGSSAPKHRLSTTTGRTSTTTTALIATLRCGHQWTVSLGPAFRTTTRSSVDTETSRWRV